jgi:hypothetical protein
MSTNNHLSLHRRRVLQLFAGASGACLAQTSTDASAQRRAPPSIGCIPGRAPPSPGYDNRAFSIAERPFAVDLQTRLMLPDGIFDVARGRQLIGVRYTPLEGLDDCMQALYVVVWAPPETGIQRPGGALPGNLELIQRLQSAAVAGELNGEVAEILGNPSLFPGVLGVHVIERDHFETPVLRFAAADFSSASPSKHKIRFLTIVHYGTPQLMFAPIWSEEKNLFVVRSYADEQSGTLNVECPQGVLRIRMNRVRIFPPAGASPETWSSHVIVRSVLREFDEARGTTAPLPVFSSLPAILNAPFILPLEFTAEMQPAAPFSGPYSELPFQDPAWWKALAAILALLFAAGAAITKAFAMDASEEQPVQWEAPSIEKWCDNVEVDPDCGPALVYKFDREFSDAAILEASHYLQGFSSASWLVVANADEIDPFRRGEELTTPAQGESTVREVIKVKLTYIDSPFETADHRMRTDWQFERHTDSGNTYTSGESWETVFPGVLATTAVEKTDYTIGDSPDDLVRISTSITATNASALADRVLYVVAFLIGPQGQLMALPLRRESSDGPFTTEVTLSRSLGLWSGYDEIEYQGVRVLVLRPANVWSISDAVGTWYVITVVQDVNTATEDMEPTQAAQIIGGRILNKLFERKAADGCALALTPHGSFEVRQSVG